MSVLNVNPTRMELRRLKARLKTAVRGHKLLKDKSDEMIRRFLIYIKENRSLRLEVEKELSLALKNFMLARAVSSDAVIEEAIAYPSVSAELETSTANVMSELDFSISTLSSLLTKMLRLAEIEKTCNMLADEIEKNKRRVNALEYVMIPQLEDTIKFITMKLDENERSSTIRLMKVKSMIENRDSQENNVKEEK